MTTHEKRVLPRIGLSLEQFRLQRNGQVFSVLNISPDGMAIKVLSNDDLVLFPLGGVIEGMLSLQREKYPIQARVIRVQPGLVGFQFSQESGFSHEPLIQLLNPRHLGSSMKPMRIEDVQTLWYHGAFNTDLVIWRSLDNEIQRIMLIYLGLFVQWEEKEGVSTGETRGNPEYKHPSSPFSWESIEIITDDVVDPGKLKSAESILNSSVLPGDLIRTCLHRLNLPVNEEGSS